MNKSLKGVLLSGLLLPGLGQVVLGATKRGVMLMLVTFACLVAMVATATQKAFAILEQLGAEGKPLTIETITEAANQAATTTGTFIFNTAVYLLIACWAFGMVDAYRTGAGAKPD